MKELHGIRALDHHAALALAQGVIFACLAVLGPSLTGDGRGLLAFWGGGVLAAALVGLAGLSRSALEESLDRASLQRVIRLSRYVLLPSQVAWLAAVVARAPGRWVSALGGLTAIAQGAILVSIVLTRRLRVREWARGRALVQALDREGRGSGLHRIEGWLAWQAGNEAAAPPMRLRGDYFPGLSSRPWHAVSGFPWVRELEDSEEVRREIEALYRRDEGFENETYLNPEVRRWRTFSLYKQFRRAEASGARCPKTMALVDRITGGISRDVMVSVLGPHGRIPLHQDSGNLFLTCHLGVVVPADCGLCVAGELRSWEQGKCFIFDSAYEHYARNDSPTHRIVLLIDFLHPDLTALEREFFGKLFAGPRAA